MSMPRAQLIVCGISSLGVLIYALFIHAALIISMLTSTRLLSRLMTPQMGVVHGIICVVGALLSLCYMYHIVCRNKLLSRQGRLLWLLAVAAGYGQIFYWYNHLAVGRAVDGARERRERS